MEGSEINIMSEDVTELFERMQHADDLLAEGSQTPWEDNFDLKKLRNRGGGSERD